MTTTLIAMLGIEGMCCSTVDGAVNREVIEAFVEHVLAPELKPGDIVVLANLSIHKGGRIGALIEQTGAGLRYPPPYSPDLNPIEMIFSKIKQKLRSLACRTREALWFDAVRTGHGDAHRRRKLLPARRIFATCVVKLSRR